MASRTLSLSRGRGAVSVELLGGAATIEALVAVSKDAERSQASAIRAAAVTARSLVIKDLAKQTGVKQKAWRKRVGQFPTRRAQGLAVRKLWVGLKNPPGASSGKHVEALIRKSNPDAFEAKMPSGHRGLFRRRRKTIPFGPGARDHPKERRSLPIDEAKLDVSGVAEPALLKRAREVMRGRYVEVLEKEFLRRTSRSISKNKARRKRGR